MTSVQLREIRQRFAGQSVLQGLDLDIRSNEYVVLLGPSGCGKTTTLRIIAGLQIPDAGEVCFNGKPVTKLAPRHRDVAMVFQHDGLYPHLNVEQSIRFALRGKLPEQEIAARVNEAVELTKIQPLLSRFPDGLSGGELRRAAIAKAIARRCPIRLLDEPMSALDAPVRLGLQDDILTWHQSVPGTTVHVTHDGQEAMRMADRIAVLRAGRVIQFGTPLEIFQRPQTIDVANSVGSINLISATAPSLRFRSQPRWKAEPSNVLVGVRPEAWRIVDRGAQHDAAELTLSGSVVRSQVMGGDVELKVEVAETCLLAMVPRQQWQGGTHVELTAAADDVHFFATDSRVRLDAHAD